MKKFFVLVKKEIKELLTPQMLVPLVVIVLVFVFIGKVVGSEADKIKAPMPTLVLDLDESVASANAIELLKQQNLAVEVRTNESEQDSVAYAKSHNIRSVLVLPAGFAAALDSGSVAPVKAYTVMSNFSFLGSQSAQAMPAALAAVSETLSNEALARQNPNANVQALKRPLAISDTVVIGDKQANISPAAVSGLISSQTTFIPIILFLVITFSSQLIALSMATEKENKTIETLLSSPISRKAIISAKLIAAGSVALLTAVVYLFGMRYYLQGLTGGASASVDAATQSAVAQLGLTFAATDYLMLGLSLFMGILVALSIAIILGAFAEDAKSVQGLTAPLMVLVLIPYFLTLFLDINTLPPALKAFVYAIPFSHPFLAAPNLLLDQYRPVLYGVLYMAVLFVVFVVIASKIFSSEKILTLKLSFKRKQNA